MAAPDPLAVACPRCGSIAGRRCQMVSHVIRPVAPHAARIKAAGETATQTAPA